MAKWSVRNIAKETIVFVVLLAIISVVVSMVRAPKNAPKTLPSFNTAVPLDSKRITLEADKPTIVYVWASWCKVCTLQSPAIEELSQHYNVLSIAVKSGNNETVQRYIKEKGYTFQVLNDSSGALAKKFNVTAYPTVFIYDSKGVLRFSEVGYTTSIGIKSRIALIE